MQRWDHDPHEPGRSLGTSHGVRTLYVLMFGIAFIGVAWGIGWPDELLLRFGVVVLVLCGIFVTGVGVRMLIGRDD
jgi:hypothetical protein